MIARIKKLFAPEPRHPDVAAWCAENEKTRPRFCCKCGGPTYAYPVGFFFDTVTGRLSVPPKWAEYCEPCKRRSEW